MGVLKAILGDANPFAQWADQNSNYLGALGGALMSGSPAAYANIGQGKALDQQAGRQKKADDLAAANLNATQRWIAQNYPQFKDLPVQEGFQLATQAQAAALKGGGVTPTTDIQNFEYGLEHPDFAAALTQKGGTSETSLTPVWGTDTNGNPVMGQLNKAGKFVPTALPSGVTAMDPGALAGVKTNATVDAKTAGAARAALPGAQVQVKTTLDSLDRVLGNQGGVDEWFGQIGPRGIYVNPGSKMGNFVSDFSQAEGQSFLQARQFLKGQGAITELESAKAEQAYSRMSAAKASGDKQNFLEAASDFRQAVLDGYSKLEATAQGGYSQGSPAVTGNGGNGGYGVNGGNKTSTGVTWSVTP